MVHQTKSRGFTIVELLIVIVIIAILAAITIVAYNGITARANTSSAKSAAESAIKKMEAFNAEPTGGSGSYPTAPSDLTGASSTDTFQLAGVTFATTGTSGTPPAAGTPPTVKPGSTSVLLFYRCTTGAQVAYWDYTAGSWTTMVTGGAATCTYIKA